MNLADFVPAFPAPTDTKFADSDINPAMRAWTGSQILKDIMENRTDVRLSRDEYSNMDSVLKKTLSSLSSQRIAMYEKYSTLPKELKFNGDPLTLISDTPRLGLEDARKIVDTMGLVLIPFNYFNYDEAAKNENSKVRAAITGFVSSLEKLFSIYVICPVSYYSVAKHVHAEHDLPIYACRSAAQAFMGVNMAIPMFRQLVVQVNDLDRRQRETDKRVNMLDTEVKNLARRVDQLQQLVEQAQREAAIAKAEAEEAKRLAEARIIANDPMLLAIPKGADVTVSKGQAIIGPCWGEDFEDIVVTLNGWKKKKDQRATLNGYAAVWNGGYR